MTKQFWKSKTNWVNTLTLLAVLFEMLSQSEHMPENYIPYFIIGMTTINLVLRNFFTRKPVSL